MAWYNADGDGMGDGGDDGTELISIQDDAAANARLAATPSHSISRRGWKWLSTSEQTRIIAAFDCKAGSDLRPSSSMFSDEDNADVRVVPYILEIPNQQL